MDRGTWQASVHGVAKNRHAWNLTQIDKTVMRKLVPPAPSFTGSPQPRRVLSLKNLTMLAPWKIQFCCLEATQSMIFCYSSLNSLRHKCFILSVLSRMSKALIMSQSNMSGNLSYELFKLAPKHPNKGVTQQQVKPKHTTRICSHMCSDRAHTPWNPANQESNLGKMLGIWALPYWNEDGLCPRIVMKMKCKAFV